MPPPQAIVVRHGMRRFEDLDAPGRNRIAVAGDDEPLKGRRRPCRVEARRHRRGRLAGADDDAASPRFFRQMPGDGAPRIGAGDRGVEHAPQDRSRPFDRSIRPTWFGSPQALSARIAAITASVTCSRVGGPAEIGRVQIRIGGDALDRPHQALGGGLLAEMLEHHRRRPERADRVGDRPCP